MSTLVAQTISNGTVSTSSENVIRGSARAWVNFNGVGGATVRASFNVSSVTYVGTGNYTVNFTNAFADTNYATNITTGFSGNGSLVGSLGATKTTTAVSINSVNPNIALVDSDTVSVSTFR
jgi:hypothetical protein